MKDAVAASQKSFKPQGEQQAPNSVDAKEQQAPNSVDAKEERQFNEAQD